MQCNFKTMNHIYCCTTACKCVSNRVAKIKLKGPVSNIQSRSLHSPVNIDTEKLSSAFMPPLKWSSSYFNQPSEFKVSTDCYSTVVTPTHHPTICGGPLLDQYKLENFHFYCGSENDKASEHSVDGKSHVMEMHVVHSKGKLRLAEAKKLPDGILIVAYFIELLGPDECTKRNEKTFSVLTECIDRIYSPSTPIEVKPNFPLKNLVLPFRYEFVNYFGTLTTPPANESVIWILAPYPLKITQAQLDKFRALVDKKLVKSSESVGAFQHVKDPKAFFVRSPYPLRQATVDKEIYKYYYPTGSYGNDVYENNFKKAMFNNITYDHKHVINCGRFKGIEECLALQNEKIYYFNDVVSFPHELAPQNAKIITYDGHKFPLYYEKNLSFSMDGKNFMQATNEYIESMTSNGIEKLDLINKI